MKHDRLKIFLQIIAVFIITVSFLFLSFKRYKIFERMHFYHPVLSDQTEAVINNLAEPIKIIIYSSSSSLGSELHKDIRKLLRKYKQIDTQKKIIIEEIDSLREPYCAQELKNTYHFSHDNILILDYRGEHQIIPFSEMGEYKLYPTNSSSHLFAFRGEEILTSSLLKLVNKNFSKKVYFIQGHGERTVGVSPLNIIGKTLERQNISYSPLYLSSNQNIPTNAGTILIISPQIDFSSDEIEKLRHYWQQGGDLFILIDPLSTTKNLDFFLSDLGITVRHDLVLKFIKIGNVDFIIHDVTCEFYPESEVTIRFVGKRVLFPGHTSSLAIAEDLHKRGNIKRLMRATHGFFGFANSIGLDDHLSCIPKNLFSQVCVSAIVDREGSHDERISIPSSRMIVVSASEFLKDQFIEETSLDFFSSCMNALIDRPYLIGTTPTVHEYFRLNLDKGKILLYSLYTMVLVPIISFLISFLIIKKRERK